MQKVFNSLMCLGVFFSWIFREVGLYSKSFLSVTGADLRERFLQLLGKALSLLGLQRSCLPAWKSLLLSKTSWGRRTFLERIQAGAAWVL